MVIQADPKWNCLICKQMCTNTTQADTSRIQYDGYKNS